MINSFSRSEKRRILLMFDWALVPVALFGAYALRFGTGLPLEQLRSSLQVGFLLCLIAPAVFLFWKLPWIKVSSLDGRGALRIFLAGMTLGILASACSLVFDVGSPRSIPVIFASTFFLLSFLGRIVAAQTLLRSDTGTEAATPVTIFGAGAAGIQLCSALRQSREVRPVCFVDDDPSYQGLLISGLRVHSRADLSEMIAKNQVKRILIAIPSLTQPELAALVTELSEFGAEIQILPSYVDLISGKTKELQTVAPDALLGRQEVSLETPEIAKSFAGRVVMVSGAGGSIGSELCKQLLECRPEKIVLYEQSELALYNIEAALRPLVDKQNIKVTACLGSVCDKLRIDSVMTQERVEIVLHAAAYKHVPLVEANEVEGARNNVLGTKILAEAAQRHAIERFILISTDKAVRPTNVMGATKRLSELVLQDLATRATKTRFSMVRFGNVLGSSGSVLPLFQKQIRLGGPVTVTHPDVTRFFMTIPEAARLVLLASSYSEGGDVFILDMGEPMQITEIARRMIEMSGSRVKSEDDPNGIEIKFTGLRPGEKLYEELLIEDDSLVATPHGKIMRASETKLSEIETVRMLRDLEAAVTRADPDGIRNVIKRDVKGYHVTEADVG